VTGQLAAGARSVLLRYLDALTRGDLAAIEDSFALDAT
jgi:hypothetical protein